MILDHPIKREIRNFNNEFDGCVLLSTYMRVIRKLAKKKGDLLGYDEKSKESIRNKFVGDGFEVLWEAISKIFLLGEFNEYKKTPLDYPGVDATAVSMLNMLPVVIQIKAIPYNDYVSDEKGQLTRFLEMSLKCGVAVETRSTNCILATTGQGIHYNTKEYLSSIKVFNGTDIRRMIDNKQGFWQDFFASLQGE